jgi:hypothetical protein
LDWLQLVCAGAGLERTAACDTADQSSRRAGAATPLRFGFVGTDSPERLKQHRAIAAEAWRIELTTPRSFLESFKVLRVGAPEVARYRDGLVVKDPMMVLLD